MRKYIWRKSSGREVKKRKLNNNENVLVNTSTNDTNESLSTNNKTNTMKDITNTSPSSSQPNNQRKKIPRPANAFMIYANENRRKVAKLHPLESNKEISIRLGTQWKNLTPSLKDKYFAMAKEVDDDHKRKYPDYVYNPKEARIRKALRDRERSIVNSSTARSRRSNWSRQSPAPQMPPIAHGDPHMNVPSKEFRSVIRHELEHGFLHNNGGYVYPSQQYLFAPQSEYMSYINAIPSSNWPGNTYNMQNNNNMVQQQIWNQYQADRVRSQQNQNYVLNAQGPQSEYQMGHMPANNVQMGPTSKSRMQQNIENAATDVDRYLNIPNTMKSSPRNTNTNNIQLDEIPIQMQNNMVGGNGNSEDSVMSASASATVTTSSMSNESNPRSIDVNNGGSQESTTSNNDVRISGTSMSEVDGSLHLDNSDNAESGFGGMQLYNEEVSSSMNNTVAAADNRSNKEIIDQEYIKQEPCTSSLLNLIPPPKQELYNSMAPTNPYLQMELLPANNNKQLVRSFMPSNTYFIEFSNPEPQIIKKQEIPLNYSAQKYYESVSNGNFDVPIISNDQYGGFVCDDNYNFVILNQSDIQPNYSYLPNQLEVNQFLTDPCNMIPVNVESTKNDDDCILDLSKEAESEQEIDVGEENCSLDKFMDVSNRICEELSKIS